MKLKRTPLLLIVVLILFLPTVTFAETTECTVIDTVPYAISQQGAYCLKDNLATSATSGIAINILTNNVTIDFNGFKLGNLGGGVNSAMVGVYASDRSNITITNGNFRGFLYGVYLAGGTGHKVADSVFDGNFLCAVFLSGQGHIERNRIVNTGGNVTWKPTAIEVTETSDGSVIQDNYISIPPDALLSYGILISSDENLIRNNTVLSQRETGKLSTGIYNALGRNNTYDNNVIQSFDKCFHIENFDGYYSTLRNSLLTNCRLTYSIERGEIRNAGGNFPNIIIVLPLP